MANVPEVARSSKVESVTGGCCKHAWCIVVVAIGFSGVSWATAHHAECMFGQALRWIARVRLLTQECFMPDRLCVFTMS